MISTIKIELVILIMPNFVLPDIDVSIEMDHSLVSSQQDKNGGEGTNRCGPEGGPGQLILIDIRGTSRRGLLEIFRRYL